MLTDNLANSSHFTIMSVIKKKTHTPSLQVSVQGQMCVCLLSPQLWSGRRWWVSGGRKHLGTGCGLLPPFHPLAPPFPFPATWSSHIYHSQLKQQKAAGKCLRKRNHNSCRSATYANMFTHEGILSKENLLHGNALNVCRVAPVYSSFKHEIMG